MVAVIVVQETAGWDLLADIAVAILAAEPGLTLTIYTAEPGSPSEEALRLLASWAESAPGR